MEKKTKTKKVVASGLEANVLTASGAQSSKISLSEKVFGLPWNADLVHQVMHSMMTNKRQPIAHTKTRGEVRGGGKKPWRQKGTGRARHGSTRSPIWVGGGIAHGPRNDRNFERKVNKVMKAKAFFTVLSKKYNDGEIIFVDSLEFSKPKTETAVKVLSDLSKVKGFEKLSTKSKNVALVTTLKKDENVLRSFRNISSVAVEDVRNVNMLDLLKYTFVVIENPVESVKVIESKI